MWKAVKEEITLIPVYWKHAFIFRFWKMFLTGEIDRLP